MGWDAHLKCKIKDHYKVLACFNVLIDSIEISLFMKAMKWRKKIIPERRKIDDPCVFDILIDTTEISLFMKTMKFRILNLPSFRRKDPRPLRLNSMKKLNVTLIQLILRLIDLQISINNNYHGQYGVNETWMRDITEFFFLFFSFFFSLEGKIRTRKMFYIKFHAGRLVLKTTAKVLSVLILILTLIFIKLQHFSCTLLLSCRILLFFWDFDRRNLLLKRIRFTFI